MTDSATETDDKPGSAEFTRSIRKLSIQADTVDDAFEDAPGTAVLLCRDSSSRKWGPKWLNQVSMQATVPSDPSNALELVRSTTPDVVFIEALLVGGNGEPIYKALLDAADISSKIIVLCNGSREISAALGAGAFDVACKPYEWQAISHRARIAMRLKTSQGSLAASNEALSEAIELANNARETLRSQQSFEPVTGLPNKSKFIDLLRRGMRAMDRDQGSLAVIVVGFTRFRLVIEAMGQEQADRILTEIGQSLGECLRNT
ncbi:MAG: diguanylate cyclase, partial [Gammaproteobacteria bacterium]|nr:diguanylate cyclase [Gammaproteobacteria bacterium]